MRFWLDNILTNTYPMRSILFEEEHAMNIKKAFYAAIFTLCILNATSAFANRYTSYHNNSNYDIKIYAMDCYILPDGKTQLCFDEQYAGFIAAHQTIKTSTDNKNNQPPVWTQAGDHVTQAVIQNPLESFDPKALINPFPICNDIHENNVNGSLTFDIDPKTNKITCTDEIIPARG